MHGTSFLYTLRRRRTPPERHTQQYFEIFGNRAMYKDGWWLSWMLPRIPWDATPETMKQFAPGVWDPDDDPVELYYLPDDFSQAHDLAAEHPEKVAELRELFWEEAEKYHVLPLLGGLTLLLRHRPAAADADDVHLLRRRAERRLRDDPADLQPLLHDQRRPGDPAGRRRRRDRGRGRPPRRLLAVRPGRQAAAHLLADGRPAYTARSRDDAAADRRASTSGWSSPPTRPSPPRAAR